jgi:hypothetical protein
MKKHITTTYKYKVVEVRHQINTIPESPLPTVKKKFQASSNLSFSLSPSTCVRDEGGKGITDTHGAETAGKQTPLVGE